MSVPAPVPGSFCLFVQNRPFLHVCSFPHCGKRARATYALCRRVCARAPFSILAPHSLSVRPTPSLGLDSDATLSG